MNREKQFVKNTMILSIGTFLPKLASFVTLPILTGYLTKEQYGYYDLVTILVSLFLPTVTLQIRTAAFRFLIEVRDCPEEQKNIITNIFAFVVPVSVVSLFILFLFLGRVSLSIRLWIVLYFFFDTLVGSTRQVARGLSYNLYYAISAIVSASGKMVFAIVAVWHFRMGLLGAVIALWASSFCSFVFLSVQLRIWRYINFSRINAKQIKELLRYSWPMVPNELSMWIMRVSDRLVVVFFMGITSNAIYAAANKIPSIITLAQNTITLAWQENASIASKDEDADEYYSHMFQVMMNVEAGFLGLVIAASPLLFRLLIRGDYSAAYIQMPVLCLALFYAGMSTYLGGIYVAHKASKSVGATTVIAALINFVTDVMFIRYIGLFAASGSTLVSYIFLCFYRMYDVRKLVRIDYDFRKIVSINLVMLIECILFYQKTIWCDVANILFGGVAFICMNQVLLSALFLRARKMIHH